MDEWKSARCESLSAVRGEFDNETEYDIAISKLDWTDLSQSDASSSSSAGSTDMSQNDASLTSAGNIVDHRHYFEVLQSDAKWGKWCSRFKNVVLGEKLAEGAQGAIFNAQVSQAGKTVRGKYVVKMMKDDCALEDFQKQWPDGLAELSRSLHIINVHGALVIDPVTQKGRFGFVMKKHMGDLRKLIDSRMEQKKGFGPPFPDRQVMRLVSWIVDDMQLLHDAGIIHKDLKAANILVSPFEGGDFWKSEDRYLTYVADWECSTGVIGTKWWRAPEILQQLKDRVPASKVEFSKKVDVYSYGMTVYEVATGKVPFDGDSRSMYETRDAILKGERPVMPTDLHCEIKKLIISCCHPDASARPSFNELSCTLSGWQ